MPIIRKRNRASISLNVPKAQTQNPAFAGQPGQAIARVGQQIQRSANQIVNTQERIRKQNAEAKFTKIRNGEDGIVASYNKFKNEDSLKDPVGHQERVSEFIENDKAEKLNAAKGNKYLTDRLEKEYSQFGAIARERARVFENTETLNQTKRITEEANTLHLSEISATGDPRIFRQAVAEGTSQITKQIGTIYTPEEASKKIQKYQKNAAQAFVLGASKKGEYEKARKLIQENPHEAFGSELSKQEALEKVNELEEKALDKQYRKERLEETKNKRRNKKIADNYLSSINTIDFTDPEQVDEHEEQVEKLFDLGILTQAQYRSQVNITQKEVKEGAEDKVLKLYNDGEHEEALATLAASRQHIGEKNYKTILSSISPSKRLSISDKALQAKFIEDIKGHDKKYNSQEIEVLKQYEEFRKKNSVEDSALLAKLKSGKLQKEPSKGWSNYAATLETKPEYTIDSIRDYKRTVSVDYLEALQSGDRRKARKIQRLSKKIEQEEAELSDFERAEQLLKGYEKTEKVKGAK